MFKGGLGRQYRSPVVGLNLQFEKENQFLPPRVLVFFPPVNFKRQSVLMSVHIRTPADDDTGNSSLLFPVQQGSGGTNRTPTPLICALRISRLLILNLVTCTPHETTPRDIR